MDKEKDKKEKKLVCFPGIEEYGEMSIAELTRCKKKVESLLDFISKTIRSKIQN